MIAWNLRPGDQDLVVWKWKENGCYSAKSAYLMLTMGSVWMPLARSIWRSKAPLKCQMFTWLAIQYRVWTADSRVRHGLEETTLPCFICDQEEDRVDHIL